MRGDVLKNKKGNTIGRLGLGHPKGSYGKVTVTKQKTGKVAG